MGWRRLGACFALAAFLIESLIAVGHAGTVSRVAPTTESADFPFAYIEICTPSGIRRISLDGKAVEDQPGDSSLPEAGRSPCLLCSVSVALPVSCPETLLALDWRPALSAPRPLDQALVLPVRPRRPNPSRAPPSAS